MTKEKQDKLFKKYPEIFRQKALPMSQTAMCWGMEFADGWYDIVDKLCEGIMKIAPEVEATQVKEKFGGLRFYTGGIHKDKWDAVTALIRKAEVESFKTCEACGSKENVSQTGQGWIKTLCKKCELINR